MDEIQDLIAELLAVTREMAGQPDGEAFAKLLQRRGELVRRLCGGSFDTSDERIRAIVHEGALLLGKTCSRRDSLRDEASSLERLSVLVRLMQATVSQPGPAGLNVTA